MQAWFDSLRTLLDEMTRVEFSYPVGNNRILPARPTADVERAVAEAGLTEVEAVLEFYRRCDGVSLPGVHNGYFLHPVERLRSRTPESVPSRIIGPYTGEIIIIGSTSGGELFAVRKGTFDLLYLPLGPLRCGVYDGSMTKVCVVGVTFVNFLDRLLADVRAFVRNTPGHPFIPAGVGTVW